MDNVIKALRTEIKSLPQEALRDLSEQVSIEMQRRAQEAADAALKRFCDWSKKINSLEIVNIIAPEHGRTSCDDQNRRNGVDTVSEERKHPRCVRCTLLDFVYDGGYYGTFPLKLTVAQLGPS